MACKRNFLAPGLRHRPGCRGRAAHTAVPGHPGMLGPCASGGGAEEAAGGKRGQQGGRGEATGPELPAALLSGGAEGMCPPPYSRVQGLYILYRSENRKALVQVWL